MYLLEKVKRFLSYRDAISFYKPIFSIEGGVNVALGLHFLDFSKSGFLFFFNNNLKS